MVDGKSFWLSTNKNWKDDYYEEIEQRYFSRKGNGIT